MLGIYIRAWKSLRYCVLDGLLFVYTALVFSNTIGGIITLNKVTSLFHKRKLIY